MIEQKNRTTSNCFDSRAQWSVN